MRSFVSSSDVLDADYDVCCRDEAAPAVTFDRPQRARYATTARHSRRKGARSTNGAHRRRNKRSFV